MPEFLHANKKKIAISLCLLLFVLGSCRFYFDTTKDQFSSTAKNGSLENGRNLTYTVCAGCHYDQKLKRFTGHWISEVPKIGGELYASNLTHSKLYGRADKYTDAELFYLLKTGIAKNGRFMPYMMKPMMADEDINDIIIFLRSDDPGLAAADTIPGKTHINLIGRTGIRLFTGPQPYNTGVQRPDKNDAVVYGKYLQAVIGCYHCHSGKKTGLDFLDPEKSKRFLIGGMKFKNPEGKIIHGPNLTPDSTTGIGSYTREEFRSAVRDGVAPSGRKLSPPMDKFNVLSNQQADAIYAYLRSLPPVHHNVRE
jgi:cytochrome c553